jgi:hypothetical protein
VAGRRYRQGVEARADRTRSGTLLIRVALALFVVAWLFAPLGLRAAVPLWLPFLIALALEVHFFLGARDARSAAAAARDRMPQVVDRERYGYREEADDLLLVRDGDEELWIPYSGETGDDVDELIAEAREREEEEEEEEAEAAAPVDAPERRRPVGQLLLGIAVIAALATLAWVVDSRSGWSGVDAGARAEAETRFSAEASRIAGHPVTIRCDESGEHVGWVQHTDGVAAVGGDLAYLAPERCHDLYRLAFGGEASSSRTGRAIAVLAHEAWHLQGVSNEGETECYALQSGVELGQRLGLSEERARQMMRQQLAENSLRSGAGVEYVVPSECRDGGSLDLHPESSEFP